MNRIRAARQALGWTQNELAQRAGVASRTIHAVEKGRACPQETKRRILSALGRMQTDTTLFAANFAHMNESGFMRGLTSLFDVLGAFPGPKAVILFSAMQDVPLEDQFGQLAALAAASRSSIYPVDVRGLLAERPPDAPLAQPGAAENLQHLPPAVAGAAKGALQFADEGGDFDIREAPQRPAPG